MSEPDSKSDTSTTGIVQITDTHIGASADFTFDAVNTLQSLATVIDLILNQRTPDCVLVTGDLVHTPEPRAYELLLEQLLRFPCPVYCLPGNHDDPAVMHARLNHKHVSTKKIIRTGDWQILMLDSHKPDTHAGYLSASELDWLATSLESSDLSTLVAIHHPVMSIGSPWMDAMGLENAGEFHRVLAGQPQVKAVICGHIHQDFQHDSSEFQFLGCPSTCVQFKPGVDEYQADVLKPGFRLLQLGEKGRILTEIFRVTS